MIQRLTTSDELTPVKVAFDRVFRVADPFGSPFRDHLTDRALLFPAPRGLSDEQLAAVAAAARVIDERDAYFSEIETYTGTGFDRYPHWRITLAEPDVHRQLREEGWSGISESALYSTNGLWGALSSHELHAVIAGQPEFMAALGRQLNLDAELDEFLHYWQSAHRDWNARVGWIPGLLRHIYGPGRAEACLAHYGLNLSDN